MKPQHLKINLKPEHSFSARHDVIPFFYNKLHYHPELELVYIIKGTGRQFIGDAINYFRDGDMVLLGENLPHLWKSDENYQMKNDRSACEAYVIHFSKDCFGTDFFCLPENKHLSVLLKKARQGIRITDNTKEEIINLMREILDSSSTKRIILLLKILDLVSISNQTTTICSLHTSFNFSNSDSEKINIIYQYIIEHFDRDISLKEISSVANLSPSPFCRYFKSRANKSFSKFLIEIRIGQACKLLTETKKPVTEICYEIGFNNLSHFNKQFKIITGSSPLQYRKYHEGTGIF